MGSLARFSSIPSALTSFFRRIPSNPYSSTLLATHLRVHFPDIKSSKPVASFNPISKTRRARISGMASSGSVQKSEEEWRAVLSPRQFYVLRQKGTEPQSTGEYDKFFEEGVYNCAGCGTPLYRSVTKFNSGCGWPAFYEGLPGAISRHPDPDGRRTEITCTASGGTWVMSLKVKDFIHQRMSGIV